MVIGIAVGLWRLRPEEREERLDVSGALPAPQEGRPSAANPVDHSDSRSAGACAAPCTTSGRCTELSSGQCLATDAGDCARCAECRARGNCDLRGGVCVPTLEEHCAQSVTCEEEGRCRLVNDELGPRCAVETHADCAATRLCEGAQRCRYAPLDSFGNEGRCVGAELVEVARWPLDAARHGVRGALVLSVDRRLERAYKGSKEQSSFAPDPEDPRAGALLELRASDGTTRGELTFFPLVRIAKENLGAGTETFLATELPSCEDAQWCGPRTRFFEVRQGRLDWIEAVGPRGTQRLFEVSATGGARWKIERRKKPPGADVLAQVEAFVPPGPALIETRFTFSRGRFRFTEKVSAAYHPSVAKQPGPWQGHLELHGQP